MTALEAEKPQLFLDNKMVILNFAVSVVTSVKFYFKTMRGNGKHETQVNAE